MKKELYEQAFDNKYDTCSTCQNACKDFENYYYNPNNCKIQKGGVE